MQGELLIPSAHWEGEGGERTVIVTLTREPAPAASREGWVHELVATQGDEPGRRMRIGPTPLRLGRRAPCEWLLADSQVSGQHCEVRLGPDGQVQVSDHGSTNGSFIEGQRVQGTALLAPGALLQVGRQVFKHDFRPPQEAEREGALERDIAQASRYVQSLLPPPMRSGPVQTEWVFRPSARLGGDAFGYFALDGGRFAGYLIDVSGHGIAAAVHTVSVMNVLRQRALPGVDLADPGQVLAALNRMFGMEEHGGLFFTIWYGVYDAADRSLRYASGGHHPAFLVDAARSAALPLATRNPVIGALPEHVFACARVEVAPGSSLLVFSDGLFEVEGGDGRPQGLADFLPRLLQPALPGLSEPERLARAMQPPQGGAPDDDVSVLAVTFLS